MDIFDGISDHSLAYLTGVTGSCGSRSTWRCSISLQNDARNSYGTLSSAMHLKAQKNISSSLHPCGGGRNSKHRWRLFWKNNVAHKGKLLQLIRVFSRQKCKKSDALIDYILDELNDVFVCHQCIFTTCFYCFYFIHMEYAYLSLLPSITAVTTISITGSLSYCQQEHCKCYKQSCTFFLYHLLHQKPVNSVGSCLSLTTNNN